MLLNDHCQRKFWRFERLFTQLYSFLQTLMNAEKPNRSAALMPSVTTSPELSAVNVLMATSLPVMGRPVLVCVQIILVRVCVCLCVCVSACVCVCVCVCV